MSAAEKPYIPAWATNTPAVLSFFIYKFRHLTNITIFAQIMCRKFLYILMLLVPLLTACGRAADTAQGQRASELCATIGNCRYGNVWQMGAAADTLAALNVSHEYNMVARNALAYTAFMQMDYVKARKLYVSVIEEAQCEIERLAADVGMMTLCYRISANRDFFDYRAAALRRIVRIEEEGGALPAADKERFVRAKIEFNIVSLCYFSNIGLAAEQERCAGYLAQELRECDDVALRLYARVITASAEADAAKRLESLAVGLNLARDKGFAWLAANYKLLLAINMRNLSLNEKELVSLPQTVKMLNDKALPADELAFSLATAAVADFGTCGDGFMKIEAMAVAASCLTQMGRYDEALAMLHGAVSAVNAYYSTFPAAADSLSLSGFEYSDEERENSAAGDIYAPDIPECLISVRREASCAYAGAGDKELSDINREAYLDLLRTTRMNKLMESRIENATENAARLYQWALAALVAFVAVIAVLYTMNSRWRRYNRIYTSNLKRVLLLSRRLMSSMPREMGCEEDVCAAVCEILCDVFKDFAGGVRFSLSTPMEPCDEAPFVYKFSLPAVSGGREYLLCAAAPEALAAEQLAVLNMALPYVAVAVEEGLRIADIGDEQLRTREQCLAHTLFLASHKRENLLKRVSVSIVSGMRPYMDRIINELRFLRRDEAADVRSRRLEYITELTAKLDDSNMILERWIKMRRGDISLQIERFAVSELFDIIAKSSPFYEARGISLEVQPSDAVVKADRALSLFMLNTLVDNAGKFTPAGGNIKVSASEGDSYVELSVEDSGIGISQQDIEKILNEKVYDAALIGDAGERLNRNKGKGFGLMNCKGIIEKYRATDALFSVCRFDITSHKGKGSRFSFRLPRGVVRCMVLIAVLVQPLCARSEEMSLDRVSALADSVYTANVRGDHARAVVCAEQAIGELNAFYREYVGGTDTLSLAGGARNELLWWREGLFPRSMKEGIFFNILDIRNEVAVAALVARDWDTYRYNNGIYAMLYRVVHEDEGLEEHYGKMRQLANYREAAIALLLFLLLVVVAFYVVSYVRHAVIGRMNSRMVLDLNSRLLAVAGSAEPLPEKQLAEELLREIWDALGDAFCFERVALLLKCGNGECVAVSQPQEAMPLHDIYLSSVAEGGTPFLSADRLRYIYPLSVVSSGEKILLGALDFLSERPLDENEALNIELVARYAASVVYHSVVRVGERYRSLAEAEEEMERVKLEENRLHVQNLVMDNCLSVIKHETLYYPSRIRSLVEQAGEAVADSSLFEQKISAVKELMDYYNSVFTILSGCAVKQLDEMSFRLSSVSLNEIFAEMQPFVARAAKKASKSVTLSCVPTALSVSGDKDMITYLFESLMLAAVAADGDAELRLTAVDCGDVVRVELLDSRSAPSEEYLAEMFAASGHNLAPCGGLKGMEYQVVKEIVRLHEEYMQVRGGRVEARRDDAGFVILFTLPK